MSLRIFMRNVGCNRRGLDAQRLISYFEENRSIIVKDPAEADVILILTCGYKKSREDESLRTIHEFQRYNVEVMVLGCLPAISPNGIRNIFEGKILSTKDLRDIDKLFPEFDKRFEEVPDANIPCGQVYGKEDDVAIIRIARGCLGKCSYCAIRFATGPLKSKPIDVCIEEFARLLENGYRKFIINAEDTGAYGLDIGSDLSELLTAMSDHESDMELDIQTLSPQYGLRHDKVLMDLIRRGIITRIKCDIQSGNRRILCSMKRFGDIEKIKDLFKKFKEADDSIHLTSQFIIGFPTETHRDFLDTVDLIENLSLTSYEIFPYSERENTPSSSMSGKISEDTISERIKWLMDHFADSDYEVVGDEHKVYLNRIE